MTPPVVRTPLVTIIHFTLRDLDEVQQFRLVLTPEDEPQIEMLGRDRRGKESWWVDDGCMVAEVDVLKAVLIFLAHRDYTQVSRTVIMEAPSPGLTEISLGPLDDLL